MKWNALGVVVAVGWGCCSAVLAAPPQDQINPPHYQIYPIGLVQTGDTASQSFGVSTDGIAVGRSLRNGGSQGFMWTRAGGTVGLPNLPGHNYCVATGAKSYNGVVVVGTCATTAFGSNRVPVIWQDGAVSQLPLPQGETLGDATAVSPAGIAVGSANSGSLQRGVIYSGGSAAFITQTTSSGSYFFTAFGISEFTQIVGQGVDPSDPARNVGIVYEMSTGDTFEVGALPGMNGAIAYGVSNDGGFVAGASMLNQGPSLPFVWSRAGGIRAIPLAAGTSQGSARAVNSFDWVVGTDSSAFAIPFLYNGTATYRLADLLPSGSGWDLLMNTSSSAVGITDGNIVVGTGVYNGQTQAFAMVPAQVLTCQICHRYMTTLTFPCDSLELARHLDHGDYIGACPLARAAENIGER